jgi:hypothetical protein
MGVIGTNILAQGQPLDTLISCSGQERMGAIGTNILAQLQQKTAISISCNGREPMGAIGTQILARRRPEWDTFISCSGREPMGVIGMLNIVLMVLAGTAMARSLTGLMV